MFRDFTSDQTVSRWFSRLHVPSAHLSAENLNRSLVFRRNARDVEGRMISVLTFLAPQESTHDWVFGSVSHKFPDRYVQFN